MKIFKWELIFTFWLLTSIEGHSKELVFGFYNQRIAIQYDESVIVKRKLKPNEEDFQRFHELMMNSQHQELINSAQYYREGLQLNDWLYYQLIDRIASTLDNRKINSDYIKWFLLSKSGYKVRIAFSKDHISIFVESVDEVFGLHKINKNYCLNCDGMNEIQHVFPRFNPYRNNKKSFSFYFDPLPKFADTKYIRKTFRLKRPDSKEKEAIVVEFDSVLMSCQRKIGVSSLHQAFSIPLTSNARKLLDRIDELTKKYSDSVRVNYLMDFVARNSLYTPDEITFDVRSKYGTPEEFLFYGEGDCADRSSFLFYALKEILRRPLLIVYYPTEQHVNVAISLELKIPPDFTYKGKPYYTCETSTTLGFVPLGQFDLIKNARYEIAGQFDPEKSITQNEKQK